MRKFYLLLSAIVLILVSFSKVEGQNINGYLWQDDNGNGVQDGVEPEIDGVTVSLLDQFGVPTGITDITGSVNPGEYTLVGAVPGVTYRIAFNDVTSVDGNYVPTAYQQGGDNTLDSDCNQTTFQTPNFVMPAVDLDDQDAGFYVTVSVGDLVWLDDNGNGIDDDGPISLPSGVNVTLYKEDPLGSGGFVIATDYLGGALPSNPINTTDNYLFDLISPGNYYVEFEDGSAGMMYHTYEDYSGGIDQASDVGDDSDARRADGQSHEFLLLSGDPLYDQVDAGYFQAYSIEGYVWEDLNGNGIDDDGSGATPVAVDVTLEIEDPIGSGGWIPATDEYNSVGTLTNPVNTSTTYSFTNLPPGNYRVLFAEPGDAAPADMHLTEQNAGGDGGVDVGDDVNDSDPDRVAVGGNGITHEILCTNARGGFMVTNVNAGYFLPIRIGDFVFEDIMGEGDQGGDPGLADPVDISLFRMDLGDVAALDVDGNAYVVPINQNGGGVYEFFPLPPGEYQVQFDWTEPDLFPTYMDAVADDMDSDIMDCNAGGASGTSRTPSTAFLNSDEEDITLDAGFFKPGRIADYVWEDLNANGIQDGNGPGIPGVQVEIFEAGTMAPVDYADCTPTAGTVVTDGGGNYEFINLRPGDYVIQFFAPSVPDQYYITLVDRLGAAGTFAGDDAADSDADPITGLTFDIPVISDDDIDMIDCGMFRGASIGDFCWHDQNGNGIQDGEPGLGGVTVSIIDINSGLEPNDLTTMAPIGNQVSDGAGFYEFANIPPGEYQLTFTEPAPDWYLTRVNQNGGPDDATDATDDSDPDELNGNTTHTVELESNEMEEDIDAGFFKAASIGDLVFHDADANGNFDDAVGMLPAGITVTVIDLITGDDPALDIMGNPAVFAIPAGGITAAYAFTGPTGLKPGSYDVRLDVPAGWFVTDLGADNVFDPGTGTVSTAPIELLSEEVNNDIDGGVYALITVGGTVWIDQNDDCTLDPTIETPGADAVILQLFDDTGAEAGFAVTTMGDYMFMDIKPGDYTIEITGANFTTGGVLENLLPCDGGNPANSDTPFDNNGMGDTTTPGPVMTDVIELRCGDEPGGGGLENKTIDFGFKFDCASTMNNPFANLDCQTAADNPICNLNLLVSGCATMWDFSNPTGPSPLCAGGSPHNTSWFSFIAGYGTYDIQFNLFGCLPGTGGQLGVQGGLAAYDPDSGTCWDVAGIVFCNDGLISPPGFSIPSTDFIPGQQYLMWLDGFSFSICGYSIDIIGDYQPFIVNKAEEVLCDGTPDCDPKCPDVTYTFEAQDADLTYEDITNLLFRWSLRDDAGAIIDDFINNGNDDFETTNSEFEWTFTQPGTYYICLDQIADICDNIVDADICQEVVILDFEDEDFGTVEICQNDLLFYNGPTTINDDPSETDDPNMDGTLSWVKTNTLVDGLNTSIFTNTFGCEVEQVVLIEELYNQGPGQLDTAICGGLVPFELDVFDATYNSEVISLLVNGAGYASNGCDTSLTINAYNLLIEGEVELVGCAPNGFEIQFVESAINNVPSVPLTYEWFDDMDNPIADDGDGNPYTTIVPSAGNYCIVISMTTEFFIPDQDEIVCPYEFCFDLNTDNFLPETPEADNWDTEFCEYDNVFTYVAETDDDPNEITFQWTYPGDVASASGETTDSLTIDWSGSIGGEVCVTITNACGTSLPVCDTIEIVPTPVAAIAPLDSICVDSVTTVLHTGVTDAGYSYAWNFGGGTPSGMTNVPGPIDVTWGAPGVKTVTLAITKSGCVSSNATTNILVVEPVPAPVITCTSTIDEVIFTWTDPSGQTGYVPDITSVIQGDGGTLNGNVFTVGGLGVGDQIDITLVTNTTSPCGDLISTGTCKAQDCPTNAVTPDPVTAICVDPTTQPFDLTAVLDTPINGTYNWVGTAITDNAAGTFDPTMATVGANTINVTFVDENLCEYSSQLVINVNPTPTSDFITDQIVICQDSTVNVEYNGSILTGGQFDWDFGVDVVAPGNGPGPFDIQWNTPGEKEITLSVTKAGCPSEETLIPVTVEPRIEPLDIDCEENATSIGITWNDLTNVTGYDVYIDNVLELSNSTDLMLDLTGLVPLTEVDIRVVANSDNACPGVEWTGKCQAVNCPPIDIVFNVSDTTLCLDATALPFQLVANVSGGPGLGGEIETWSGPGVDANTGIFDPAAAGVSGPSGHTITYTYMEANCEETATLKITLINQPTSDFTAPPVICVTDNLEITYSGSAPSLPFTWDVEDGASPTTVGPNTYVTSWTEAGIYDISLQVGQGTCLSDVTTIAVQVDPEMEPVDISCTTTLNSVTFNWDDIDCATDYQVSIDNVIIGNQTDLTFPVTGLNEGDKVTIEILPIEECACPAIPISLECEARACPPVVLNLTTPVDEFCEGELTGLIDLEVEVEGSETAGSGSWSGDGGVSSTGSFDPSNQAPGLYMFTYSYAESGCDFEENISITVNENPTVAAVPTDPICYQDNVGSVIVNPAGGTGSNFVIELDGTAVTPAELTGLDPDNYSITVIDEKGCEAETTFVIQDAIAAQLDIQGATLIKAGDEGTLVADVTSIDGVLDSIVWYNSDGIICSGVDCETITFSPEVDDTYCATMYYNDGCTVEECVNIVVRKVDVIILPNVITPGSEVGGTINGEFYIPQYETILRVRSLLIYDRWGNKMFKSEGTPTGPGFGWNGSMNGRSVAQGVYIYTVELDMVTGEVLQLSGDITVLAPK